MHPKHYTYKPHCAKLRSFLAAWRRLCSLESADFAKNAESGYNHNELALYPSPRRLAALQPFSLKGRYVTDDT